MIAQEAIGAQLWRNKEVRSDRTGGRVTESVKGYVNDDYEVDRPHPEG